MVLRVSFTAGADLEWKGGDPPGCYAFCRPSRNRGTDLGASSPGCWLSVALACGRDHRAPGQPTLATLGSGFQMMSISDPDNADDVITVGATHRTDPHRYGPISRSARGPTDDGRNKPDLLAPGDRVWGPVPGQGWGQKSGTSQAASHVSGVAAMLLARYPELRGRPRRIKAVLCETATDLGRLVHFQGHGLVDALRALQRP